MTGNITYVKQKSGVIYAYENLGTWDPINKKKICRRKLLGRFNPETGAIEPTTVTNGLRRSMFRSLTRRITKCHAPLRKEARKSSGF